MLLHVLGEHSLGAQLALVPRGTSRSFNLPREGNIWVQQETCPSTKLPARSLMFSFSFCFRGQRGLAPLKQTENEDHGKPSPHPNETSLRRKQSWGGKTKGNLQMVSSSFPAGAVGTQGWHRDPVPGLSHLAPSLLWELELLVLQDEVYEMEL